MFSIMALKIGTEVDKISSKYCFLKILSPSTLILGRNLKHELARSCFTLKYFQSFLLLIHSLKPCCQRLRGGRFPQMCKSRRLNYFSIIDSAKLIIVSPLMKLQFKKCASANQPFKCYCHKTMLSWGFILCKNQNLHL